MGKPILRLLKSHRGLELLRCFEDMSLRDTSIVCGITFSALKSAKDRLRYQRWAFYDLRNGKAGGFEKWDEICKYRDEIMLVKISHADW